MIREVYKGIMKAVERELRNQLPSMVFQDELSSGVRRAGMGDYIVLADSIAYNQICRAFRQKGGHIHVTSLDELKKNVQQMAVRMGMSKGCVDTGYDQLDPSDPETRIGYVSLRMGNTKWKFGLVLSNQVFLAPAMTPQTYNLFFEGISNAEVILPELDRMQPVLERMTRNIVDDIRKERLANEIKDIANKHNGNEQSRKKNP